MASPATELRRFILFCRVLGLKIEPFQRAILIEVFEGRRELTVLIPRGQGKTTLFAVVALWHLLTHAKPRIYLAAASSDQADIAFEVARDMVLRHPQLKSRIKAQRRKLVRVDGAGFMRVISSDAGRQHGLMPTLALVDELHAHKNPDLYVALKTAMGKNPEAQLVTISTAGHSLEETLGQLRTTAFAKGDIEDAGPRFRIARIPASDFVLLEWACRDDDDLSDPAVVKLANPASFVTEAFLLEQIHSPGLHPVEFATYHANVWRSGVDSWLAYGAWEACAAAANEEEWTGIPPGADVWLGVDMGRSNDAASVVAVALREDGTALAECSIYHPPEDGKLAFETVEQAILDAHDHWRIRGCAYDPWHFDRSAELLADKGVPMLEFRQNNERMGPATHQLLETINTRRIRHNGDAEFTRHVVNGHAEQTARGIRLKKDPKTRREDDACLALCMAHALARGPDERSVFERRADDDFLL